MLRCRDPAADVGGITLVGETVAPGIAADNPDSIFEEHSVVASMRAQLPAFPFYARAERVFSFGPVVAMLASAVKAAPAGHRDGHDASSGAVAGLKLSNPYKARYWLPQ